MPTRSTPCCSAPTAPPQACAPGAIVVLSSTVDPVYPAALAPKLAERGILLLDSPVSGGPAKAAAGTMTMMVSGDAGALRRMRPVLERITGRLFALGPRAGDASAFKIVNNLLAAANLAAGAEAMALAIRAGLDPQQVFDVVNASSGGSWIFADRMARALANDYAPRAAAKILTKDVGIAAALAERLGVDAPLTRAAHAAFVDAVAAGYGEEDDAALSSARPISRVCRPPARRRSMTPRPPDDVDVLPHLRADRVRPVVADPGVQQVIFEDVDRQPPRRVRDHELRHPVEQLRALAVNREACAPRRRAD